jgi:hypothetical protein
MAAAAVLRVRQNALPSGRHAEKRAISLSLQPANMHVAVREFHFGVKTARSNAHCDQNNDQYVQNMIDKPFTLS